MIFFSIDSLIRSAISQSSSYSVLLMILVHIVLGLTQGSGVRNRTHDLVVDRALDQGGGPICFALKPYLF